MYKAIFYKEWIKLRASFFVLLIISLLFLVQILLIVSYNARVYGEEIYWYNVIFRNDLFYDSLFYLPLLIGLIVLVVQFAPEIAADRLKLTLHLPAKDRFILLSTVSVGTILILILFMFIVLGLYIVTLFFFPWQIYYSALLTMLPKFLAGLALYWAGTMIFVESMWIKRIILTIIALLFIQTLFLGNYIEIYTRIIAAMFIISLILSISILISGHRYRRGVR
ncbi:MAG TPA: hypothetical protein EYP36_04850 [Calditrichaeota bacterium]|nr:hypothetical protein [Calditrichota bacterium]